MAERARAIAAASWREINELASDFADGVIREVGVAAGEYVDATGVLYYDGYPRLVAHAQMQGAGGTSVRLEFTGVRKFAFDYDIEVSPAIATDIGAGVWEVRLLGLRVTAEECVAYITGDHGLGAGPFVLQR